MAKGGNEQIMVAAIDFGTTFSGYAFSFRHEFQKDPLKVVASQWLTGSRAAISLKTSSCILFDKNKKFAAFGFEAEDQYSDLTLDGLDAEWYYFRRFKMQLYSSQVGYLDCPNWDLIYIIKCYLVASQTYQEHPMCM